MFATSTTVPQNCAVGSTGKETCTLRPVASRGESSETVGALEDILREALSVETVRPLGHARPLGDAGGGVKL